MQQSGLYEIFADNARLVTRYNCECLFMVILSFYDHNSLEKNDTKWHFELTWKSFKA